MDMRVQRYHQPIRGLRLNRRRTRDGQMKISEMTRHFAKSKNEARLVTDTRRPRARARARGQLDARVAPVRSDGFFLIVGIKQPVFDRNKTRSLHIQRVPYTVADG